MIKFSIRGLTWSELTPRDESGVPVTQILCEFKSMCGSNVGEYAASVAGLSFPSLDAQSAPDLRPEQLWELSPGCCPITDLGHVPRGDQEW